MHQKDPAFQFQVWVNAISDSSEISENAMIRRTTTSKIKVLISFNTGVSII